MTTINLEHMEGFDRTTKAIYKLIHLASFPESLIKLLPNFFTALERDTTCKKTYSNLMQAINNEDQEVKIHKLNSVQDNFF